MKGSVNRVVQKFVFNAGDKERPYPILVKMVVSEGRKFNDYITVSMQTKQQQGRNAMSSYSNSLFESCFKNW